MIHDDYKMHVAKFTNEMVEVTQKKNHDYSVRDDDAMDNFKLVGEMLGISPRLVWSVLWMKHVTAVINHMAKDKTLKDETIHGRFIDLANYAMLGDALDKDLANADRRSKNTERPVPGNPEDVRSSSIQRQRQPGSRQHDEPNSEDGTTLAANARNA